MTPRERLGGRPPVPRLRRAAAARSSTPRCAAGVDLIQLRDKTLDDDGAGRRRDARSARAARRAGALFILNDRPDLRRGVRRRRRARRPGRRHARARRARRSAPDRIVGRSTHAPAQADAADADPDVDYLAVGPVHATPTKPGRPAPASTTSPTRRARSSKPWFAIGGLDARHAAARSSSAGARRVVVVRAIAEAADPEAAAARRCAHCWRCPLGQRSRKRRASAATPRGEPDGRAAQGRRREATPAATPAARGAQRRRPRRRSSRSRPASARARSPSPRSSRRCSRVAQHRPRRSPAATSTGERAEHRRAR